MLKLAADISTLSPRHWDGVRCIQYKHRSYASTSLIITIDPIKPFFHLAIANNVYVVQKKTLAFEECILPHLAMSGSGRPAGCRAGKTQRLLEGFLD